jgi:hypothetical protein
VDGMAKEIVEKIPSETCWLITAQSYTAGTVAEHQTLCELLGKEKFQEMNDHAWAEGGKMAYPQIQQSFKIAADDCIGASNLVGVVALLVAGGPEYEWGPVGEETPERVVYRITKCPWMERYKEQNVKPEFRMCPSGHEKFVNAGLEAVNSPVVQKLTKFMPRGDPYCEVIYELKK